MKMSVLVLMLVLSVTLFGQEKSGLPLPSSGDVTLPLSEYNRLVELAAKPVKRPEMPPLPYAIKRAELKLRVGNESVLGTVQLDGEVFTRGATKVPLTTGITVLDAH